MKKLIRKFQYFLCKSYLKKHIKIAINQNIISDIELLHGSDIFLDSHIKQMAHDIAMSLLKEGAIVIERERSERLAGDIVRLRLQYWV